MRHLIVLIFSFLLSFNTSPATSEDVPALLKVPYKLEMEDIIHRALPAAYKQGQRGVADAKAYRDKIIENHSLPDSEECRNLEMSYDFIQAGFLSNVYTDIIKASSKYHKVDPAILSSWWFDQSIYVETNLAKNQVNTKELDKLFDYAFAQGREVVQYIKDTDRYCHIYSSNPHIFDN